MKQVKGFIAGILVAALFMAMPVFADAVSETISVLKDYVTVEIDGETKDVRNFVHEGTTYIALRDVSELLGCTVGWDDATRTASISTGKAPAQMTTAAIEVNGKVISDAEFSAMYTAVDNYYGTKMTKEEKIQFVKDELVMQSVANAKAEELKLTNKDELRAQATAELAELDAQYGADMTNQLLQAYYGQTREQYIESCITEASNQALLDYMSKNLPKYAEAEAGAKEFYEANKESYKQRSVQVKHILIPTNGENEEAVKAEVDKIASQVNKDTFDMVLLSYNNDPGQPENGYLVTGDGTFVPEFEEAALAFTEAGQISKPVKTSYGYHILMAVEINEYLPYETFLKSYLQQKYSEIDLEYLKEWVAGANVVYHDDVINTIVK